MTSNQIAYFKAKIDEEHYARSDLENQRHNYAVERLQGEQNEETRRSNLARELETHRSNVANESNYYANLQENIRHNQVSEAQGWTNLGLVQDRYQYQNLLDTATTNLRNAETTLTGQRIIGQETANKQTSLNYNLDANYAETERVFNSKNTGGTGNRLVDSVLTLGQFAAKTFGFSNSNVSKTNKPDQISSKPYYALNTR